MKKIIWRHLKYFNNKNCSTLEYDWIYIYSLRDTRQRTLYNIYRIPPCIGLWYGLMKWLSRRSQWLLFGPIRNFRVIRTVFVKISLLPANFHWDWKRWSPCSEYSWRMWRCFLRYVITFYIRDCHFAGRWLVMENKSIFIG